MHASIMQTLKSVELLRFLFHVGRLERGWGRWQRAALSDAAPFSDSQPLAARGGSTIHHTECKIVRLGEGQYLKSGFPFSCLYAFLFLRLTIQDINLHYLAPNVLPSPAPGLRRTDHTRLAKCTYYIPAAKINHAPFYNTNKLPHRSMSPFFRPPAKVCARYSATHADSRTSAPQLMFRQRACSVPPRHGHAAQHTLSAVPMPRPKPRPDHRQSSS